MLSLIAKLQRRFSKSTVKIILMEDVPTLGSDGDIVSVKLA
jgi:hypothetical protein